MAYQGVAGMFDVHLLLSHRARKQQGKSPRRRAIAPAIVDEAQIEDSGVGLRDDPRSFYQLANMFPPRNVHHVTQLVSLRLWEISAYHVVSKYECPQTIVKTSVTSVYMSMLLKVVLLSNGHK